MLFRSADKTKLNGIATGATTKVVSQKAKWNAAANGTWTITGLTIGAPLIIIHENKAQKNDTYCRIRARSGCVGGKNTTDYYAIGVGNFCSNNFVVIPTAATVTFDVKDASDDGDVLYAYQ